MVEGRVSRERDVLQNRARRLILLSPIAVIATGQMVVRLVDARLGAWGWRRRQ
jgi:hypothetical protein